MLKNGTIKESPCFFQSSEVLKDKGYFFLKINQNKIEFYLLTQLKLYVWVFQIGIDEIEEKSFRFSCYPQKIGHITVSKNHNIFGSSLPPNPHICSKNESLRKISIISTSSGFEELLNDLQILRRWLDTGFFLRLFEFFYYI